MFLALFARQGHPSADLLQAAIDDFKLDGKRDLERIDRGPLTVIVSADRPLPPTAEEDGGRRFVVASGEAFDVASSEAGHSDLSPELLRRFVQDGSGLTPPRNGTFAFLAHDAEKNEIVLGNDAFGFQPLFVLETPEFVAVANELEPLMKLAPEGGELDPDGVAEYFVFNTTLGGRTLVKGVRNLDPGSIVTITEDNIEHRTHDTLDVRIDRTLSFEEHAKRVGEALREAVQRRFERYPDAIASLTGGADTRLILSCTTPEQRKRTKYVTHYLVEGKADDDRDVVTARRLAERAGLQHEAIFREGAGESFSAAGYDKLRERPVTPEQIHGVWGGEFLGGAAVDVALFPVERVTRETVASRVERLLAPELREAIVDPYDSLQTDYARCKAENSEFQFCILNFVRPYQTQLYFGSAGLSAGSWMWPWAQSLRLTSPFLDAEFLRVLLSVPFEYVSGYRLYSEIYRQCFPEFNDIPTNSGLAVRSDSALTMYVEGTEPKRRHKDLTRDSRRAAFRALDESGKMWDRGLLARDVARAQCIDEITDHPPTFTDRMKTTYTKSVLFKSRKYIPVHGMLMKLKAKQETAKAATLDAPLVGGIVDFDYWCEYSGIQDRAHAKT